MRRALQEGQTPRPLQEKGTRRSAAHASERVKRSRGRGCRSGARRGSRPRPIAEGFAIGVGRCGVGEEGFEVVLEERVEGCGGGIAPTVDGSDAVGPRRCRWLREGTAGRGPAGAGRRGCGHGDDGAAAGGRRNGGLGQRRGSGRRRNSPVFSGISYPVSRHNSQEVCPYTRKFSRPSSEPAFASRGPGEAPFGVQLEAAASRSHPGTRSPSLIALLETALDEAAWDAFSRGSAMRRSGRVGFARNVCVGLGNWGSPDAVPVLSRALTDPELLVRAHAAWALGRVGSAEARSALLARASVETDACVLEEFAAAMDA
jgi:hypothetical protein